MSITQTAFQRYEAPHALAALLAAEFVDRCGRAAIGALAARRDTALARGDDPGAEGWRQVLKAAEAMLAARARMS
jgi:hypothetical protein